MFVQYHNTRCDPFDPIEDANQGKSLWNLQEDRGLPPEMAMRVAKLLNTTPESWLRMQEAVDLWEMQQKPEKLADITPIKKELLAA